jgi:hypothetical protein
MTRSALRSGPSRGIAFALFAAGLTLLAASPASAKKKKAASDDVPQATDTSEAAPVTNDKPAAQADDTEKPKAIIDQNQEAPKTDSLGHVHFASPNGEGLGRVTVNAPAADKVKVFLEGRLFGTAPITIYSVPKGDYIVEGTYPSGKQVKPQPVTVSENEETTVDLAKAPPKANAEGGGSSFGGEMTSGRKTLMYGFLIGAAAGIVLGTTFGILDLQAESDYNKATTQASRDDIQSRGQRDANIADVGWVVAAVGLVGAGICALPMIFGGEKTPASSSAPAGTPSAFMLAPVAGHGMTGGAMMMRF